MSIILKELIQRAIEIARPPDGISPAIAEETVEALLPSVFAAVGQKMAAGEYTRTALRRTKQLNFLGGPVLLDEDVLTDYLTEATLLDPTDPSKQYSLAPWDQFVSRQLDQRLGHFSIEGELTAHVVEPGFVYDPTLEPTVLLNLTTPCDPVIPLAITDPVLVIDQVAEELISALAIALRTTITP